MDSRPAPRRAASVSSNAGSTSSNGRKRRPKDRGNRRKGAEREGSARGSRQESDSRARAEDASSSADPAELQSHARADTSKKESSATYRRTKRSTSLHPSFGRPVSPENGDTRAGEKQHANQYANQRHRTSSQTSKKTKADSKLQQPRRVKSQSKSRPMNDNHAPGPTQHSTRSESRNDSRMMTASSIRTSSHHSTNSTDTAPSATSEDLRLDLASAKHSLRDSQTPAASKKRDLSFTIGDSSVLGSSRSFINYNANHAAGTSSFVSSASMLTSPSQSSPSAIPTTPTAKAVLPDLVTLEQALHSHQMEDIQEQLERLLRKTKAQRQAEHMVERDRSRGSRDDGTTDSDSISDHDSTSNDDDGDDDDDLGIFQQTPVGWKTPFEVDAPRELLTKPLDRKLESRSLSPLLARSDLTEEQCAWAGIDDILENRSVDDSYALSTSDVLPQSIANALKRSSSKRSMDDYSIGLGSIISEDSEPLQPKGERNVHQNGYNAGGAVRMRRLARKNASKYAATLAPIQDEGGPGHQHGKMGIVNDRDQPGKIRRSLSSGNLGESRGQSLLSEPGAGNMFQVFQWSRRENVDETMLKKKTKKLNSSPRRSKPKKKATFSLDETAHSLPSLDSFRDDDLVSKAGLLSIGTFDSRPVAKSDRRGGVGNVRFGLDPPTTNPASSSSRSPPAVHVTDFTRSQSEVTDESTPSHSQQHEEGDATRHSASKTSALHHNDGHAMMRTVPDHQATAAAAAAVVAGISHAWSSNDGGDDDDLPSGEPGRPEGGISNNTSPDNPPTESDATSQHGHNSSAVLANDGLVLDATVDMYIREMQAKIEVPDIDEHGTPRLNGKKHKKSAQLHHSSSSASSRMDNGSPSPTTVVAGDQSSAVIDELPSLSSLAEKKSKSKNKGGDKKKARKGQLRKDEKKEPKLSLATHFKNSIRSLGSRRMSVASSKKGSSVAFGDESKYFPKGTVTDSRLESNKCLLLDEDDDFS